MDSTKEKVYPFGNVKKVYKIISIRFYGVKKNFV